MEQQKQQQRQTAHIVQINDLLNSRFVKEDGWNPNYVAVGDKNVSRVNIIGTVIGNGNNGNVQDIIIDDGTGKITARDFEKKTDVGVGEIILLVGKIRQFGSERYIAPEIIKRGIDIKWNLLWKKNALKAVSSAPAEKIEEEKIDAGEENNGAEKILLKIRELDDGSGASYNDVIKIVRDEKAISRLLMRGEIFELRPGRLKVLD